jgi:nucleoside-diphosphate-sugar epimerase
VATVAISGASGYLGSHLCAAFAREGDHVVALKRRTSSLARLASLASRVALVDIDASSEALFAQGPVPQVVIHAATSYGRKGETPRQVAASNVDFALRLLDSAAAAGARVFINVDTILPPEVNDYARTKHEFRIAAVERVRRHGIGFVNVRMANMYGPWDDASKFTTHVIRSCAANVDHLDLTHGEQSRDFVYIEDVADAFVLIARRALREAATTASVDLASGRETSIRAFAETAHRLARSTTRLNFGALPFREGDLNTSGVDASALASLGWVPRYDVEGGIRETLHAEGLA